MWAARSREESSDRGSGSLYSSKIYNSLYNFRKIILKIFPCSGVPRAAAVIFWNFFGVFFCVFRVPEPTRIYNQQELISTVGLNSLIKRTVRYSPRQRSGCARAAIAQRQRGDATCRDATGYSQRSERADRASHAAWTNSSASA